MSRTNKKMQAGYRVADALRDVATALDSELGSGRRSRMIDALDLVETLLAVADRLDPPLPTGPTTPTCPGCGEGNPRPNSRDDDTILCQKCGMEFVS